MVQKRLAEMASSAADIDGFAAYLVKQIGTGSYRTQAKTWVRNVQFDAVNHNGNANTIVDWAGDSDAANCEYVWGAVDADPDQDFSAAYYSLVAPKIDLQLAKAGLRLAYWLNSAFASC